jgi:hypothetical protein
MSSQKILEYIDDQSFDTPTSRAANDPTGVPNFPPEEGRGDDFNLSTSKIVILRSTLYPRNHLNYSSFSYLFPLYSHGLNTPTAGSLTYSKMLLLTTGIPPFLNSPAFLSGKASPPQQLMYGLGSLLT